MHAHACARTRARSRARTHTQVLPYVHGLMNEHYHMKPNTLSQARTHHGHLTYSPSCIGTLIPYPGELESTTDHGSAYELHYSDTIPGTVLQPDPRSAASYCNDYAGSSVSLPAGLLLPTLLTLRFPRQRSPRREQNCECSSVEPGVRSCPGCLGKVCWCSVLTLRAHARVTS